MRRWTQQSQAKNLKKLEKKKKNEEDENKKKGVRDELVHRRNHSWVWKKWCGGKDVRRFREEKAAW